MTDRLRQALHAAVDAFCDTIGEALASPEKPKPRRRRRVIIPPPTEPVSDRDIAFARRILAKAGVNLDDYRREK